MMWLGRMVWGLEGKRPWGCGDCGASAHRRLGKGLGQAPGWTATSPRRLACWAVHESAPAKAAARAPVGRVMAVQLRHARIMVMTVGAEPAVCSRMLRCAPHGRVTPWDRGSGRLLFWANLCVLRHHCLWLCGRGCWARSTRRARRAPAQRPLRVHARGSRGAAGAGCM